MPHSLSNCSSWIMASSRSAVCDTAAQEIMTQLTEKYGLPACDLNTLGESDLIRTAATLDFLTNNLPPEDEVASAPAEPCEA
jgi:hypothetical protein